VSDKLTISLSNKEIDGIFFSILTDIHSAICDLSDNQSNLLGLISATRKPQVNKYSKVVINQAAKKVRKDITKQQHNSDENGEFSEMEEDDDADPLDEEIRVFRKAVKDAEKSSLIFNLNMGKTPIMNSDTMLQRATKALTDMAASNEGSRNGPSEDTISSMDDVLSMVKKVSFYGKTTKTFRHPTSKESGSYCTVPVRYDFKDKDTRVRAEMRLRESCKVMCTTPYHPTLRESVKQVVQHFKKENPTSLIRVVVDTGNMCMRVSRKPQGESDWLRWDYTIPIPDVALDTKAKKVPDGFKVMIPIRPPSQPAPNGDTGLVDLTKSLGGASRLSRKDSPPKKTHP